MIKNNKTTLIITSLVLLFPVLVGLILWDKLPEQIPTHWGIHGEVDGWSSKSTAVFLLPCIMLGIHWLCLLATKLDPKKEAYTAKMLSLVLWITPALSLLISTLMYSKALGYDLDINIILPLPLGLIFIVIGNLLPKMRQSYTMGIKLPWTLNNEDNWNKTHRLSGKIWVAGGIVILATAILGNLWIMLGVLVINVMVPTIYSYCLYRKQTKAE